jgi:uncharacterized alkaline shock family protein YloU
VVEHRPDAPESVHSPAVSAHISHAVIATYAADAALEAGGVHGLLGGHFGSLDRRIDPERAAKAVRVDSDALGGIALELHIVVEEGVSIPETAQRVREGVRGYLSSMIDLDVEEITVLVDGLAPPDARAGAR